MNPLHPSGSTTANRTDFISPNTDHITSPGRLFNANEHQHFYRGLHDSTPSSSTLRLALCDPNAASQPNAEANLTNMDRFSAGSPTPFHSYNHEPSASSESYQFHAEPSISFQDGRRRIIAEGNRGSLEMTFLHQSGVERAQSSIQGYQWVDHLDAAGQEDRNRGIHSAPEELSVSDKSATGSQQTILHAPLDLPRPRPIRGTMAIPAESDSTQTNIRQSLATPASVMTHGYEDAANAPAQPDANQSTNPKKKHGCWMCHKSFDRPRYGI
jgi:hypothetical protein